MKIQKINLQHIYFNFNGD